MTTFVADASVVGVVGPFNSSVAKVQIPISNEAGLLQCSPANTNPDLTKGDAGKELRAKNPDKINYVRVATTDDIQGPAVAQYGINELGLKKVAIIDDTETYGKGIADAFSGRVDKLGGEVVGREGAPKGTTDYTAILTKFKDAEPRRRVLRRRDGDRRRPRAQADAAGRPRRPSPTSAATASRTARAPSTARSSTSPATPLPTPSARSPRSRSTRARPTSTRSTSGRVRRRCRRLQRLRLRLRPGRARRHQGGRRQGRRHPRGRPRRRHRHGHDLPDRPRPRHVRRGRRHQPEDHLPVQGRPRAADGAGDWVFDSQVDYK